MAQALRQTRTGSSTTHTKLNAQFPIGSCDASRSNHSWRCLPLITTMSFIQESASLCRGEPPTTLHWDTVSNLLFIDATTSNIFLKTRDYRRIESVYLAQQIPRQDKTRRHYTVILSAPLCDHYIDKSKSKGLGTVLGDRASLQ